MLLEHKKKKPGLSPNQPSNNWALGTNNELCEKGTIFSHQRYIFSHLLRI